MCEGNEGDITVKDNDKEYSFIMSPKDSLKLLKTILGKKLSMNPEEAKLYHNMTLLKNEMISSFKTGELIFVLARPAAEPEDPDERTLSSLASSSGGSRSVGQKGKSKDKGKNVKSKPY